MRPPDFGVIFPYNQLKDNPGGYSYHVSTCVRCKNCNKLISSKIDYVHCQRQFVIENFCHSCKKREVVFITADTISKSAWGTWWKTEFDHRLDHITEDIQESFKDFMKTYDRLGNRIKRALKCLTIR